MRISSNERSGRAHLNGLLTVVFPSGFTRQGPFSTCRMSKKRTVLPDITNYLGRVRSWRSTQDRRSTFVNQSNKKAVILKHTNHKVKGAVSGDSRASKNQNHYVTKNEFSIIDRRVPEQRLTMDMFGPTVI